MAYSTINTKVYQKNSSGGSYTEIADVMEVPELGGKRDKIDTTNLSDTIKKNIFGVKDLGDASFKFYFNNSGATANWRVLKGYDTANTLVYWKVAYSDGTTAEFTAYVSTTMDSVKASDKYTFTTECAIQSDITWTNPA